MSFTQHNSLSAHVNGMCQLGMSSEQVDGKCQLSMVLEQVDGMASVNGVWFLSKWMAWQVSMGFGSKKI